MKNEQLYNRTIDILVNAYFRDELEHSNCHACAVGNIVAANCGYKYREEETIVQVCTGLTHSWKDYDEIATWYDEVVGVLSIRTPEQQEIAKMQVNSTGYTREELGAIEAAFENNQCLSGKCDPFDGLMMVVEALDIIHENTDNSLSLQMKERFKKELV